MKKILSVLLILAMARIGFTFLDSSSADVQVTPVANQEDYFFGVKNAQSNFNQVLALLVGRNGTPGPVGVAGRDGLIGVDGTAGPQGLPGAPGAAGQSGRDGAGVIAVSFSGREGSCINGGIRFTDAAGAVSFACNGTPGPAGAPGSQGAQGPQGAAGSGGSGGSLNFGQGNISITACEADGVIKIDVKKLFTGNDFRLNEFTVGSGTSPGDILDTCASKTVALYLKIGTGTLVNGGTNGTAGFNYQNNDIIKCTATLPAAANWPSSNPQFTFTSNTLTCVNQTTALPGGAALTYNEISSADYLPTVGFEIG